MMLQFNRLSLLWLTLVSPESPVPDTQSAISVACPECEFQLDCEVTPRPCNKFFSNSRQQVAHLQIRCSTGWEWNKIMHVKPDVYRLCMSHLLPPQVTACSEMIIHTLTVSVAQEFRGSLPGLFWLGVSHEVALRCCSYICLKAGLWLENPLCGRPSYMTPSCWWGCWREFSVPLLWASLQGCLNSLRAWWLFPLSSLVRAMGREKERGWGREGQGFIIFMTYSHLLVERSH